jgi:hypothetical protein
VQLLLLLRSCCHWCCGCASTTLLLTANHLRKLSPLDAAMMKSTTAAAIKICNKHRTEQHTNKDTQLDVSSMLGQHLRPEGAGSGHAVSGALRM